MLIDANVSVPVDLLLCVLFDSVHVGVSVCVLQSFEMLQGSYVHDPVMW